MRRRWLLGGALGVGGAWALQRGVYVPSNMDAGPRTDESAVPAESPEPPDVGPAADPPVPRFTGKTDVTFLVISDLHFGAYMGGSPLEPVIDKAIAAMNEIEGKPWPTAIGGRVGPIRGVLAAGDLTEDGRPWEWARFVETMGLRGEGKLRHPIYESLGNHDGHDGQTVRLGIVARHGAPHYAWTWDDVRMICLADGPDDSVLSWLDAELAGLDADASVVLYQHFPLGGAFSTGQWFGDGDYREKLAKTLERRRVRAIFHGHFHATGHYLWKGKDTYVAGSPKHSWRSFLVVNVSAERTIVGAYHYERNSWWWWHDRREGSARIHFPAGAFVRA
jgi:hypothetical protein